MKREERLRIFVGYGGTSAEKVAQQLFEYLQETEDWETYKAPDSVPIGNWESSTLSALKKADVFLVVYSHDSWASEDLWKEIVLAEEWDITIYPIVEERIDVKGSDFPRMLRTDDAEKYNPRRPRIAFSKIARKLKRIEYTLPYIREFERQFSTDSELPR